MNQVVGVLEAPPPPSSSNGDSKSDYKSKDSAKKRAKDKTRKKEQSALPTELLELKKVVDEKYQSVEGQFFRKLGALLFAFCLFTYGKGFGEYCDKMAIGEHF